MSRIGKSVIDVPAGVEVSEASDVITVKGPKGELTVTLPQNIKMETTDDQKVQFVRSNEEKKTKSEHGLVRSLTANCIQGVTEGFEKKLEVNGVGFKVNLAGKNLKLALGFSHDVMFAVPEDIEIIVDGNNITVKGINKQRVGQVAAQIRELKKPEPYKGKGIKYEDEVILRKAGKAAGAGD